MKFDDCFATAIVVLLFGAVLVAWLHQWKESKKKARVEARRKALKVIRNNTPK